MSYVHDVAPARRDQPLFDNVTSAFAFAAIEPMRQIINQVPDVDLRFKKKALLFSIFFNDPITTVMQKFHQAGRNLKLRVAGLDPKVVADLEFRSQMAREAGYHLASTWLRNCRLGRSGDDTVKAYALRPGAFTQAQKFWNELLDAGKPYGLHGQQVDTIICQGLDALTQHGRDIELPQGLVAENATVKAALARPYAHI